MNIGVLPCKGDKHTAEISKMAKPDAASVDYGEPKAWMLRIAAELATGNFLPSDIIDDYPQKTYSASRVAQMMEQPREQARTMAHNLRQVADLLP